MFKKAISIDFDGVLHQYVSKWTTAAEILDGPVPGAIEWLKSLLSNESICVNIFSARNAQEDGIKAMREWLGSNGLDPIQISKIEFPLHKPIATLYVDDRGYKFTGDNYPSAEEVLNFKPWNRS